MTSPCRRDLGAGKTVRDRPLRRLLYVCIRLGDSRIIRERKEVGDEPGKLFLQFAAEDLLAVRRFQYLIPLPDGRLGKRLAVAQLRQDFGSLKFLFIFLKCLVNIFAILGINYKHVISFLRVQMYNF